MNGSDIASLIRDEAWLCRGTDETDWKEAQRRSDGKAEAPI